MKNIVFRVIFLRVYNWDNKIQEGRYLSILWPERNEIYYKLKVSKISFENQNAL